MGQINIAILFNLYGISEIFNLLFNEDPVENMLQIVTVQAGFNNDYCYTDFHTNI